MKALVTGGAGFIGSTLVDMLIEDGYDVVVIDNESADSNEQFYYNPKANNYKLDICDYDATRKLYDGVDVVFHLAAESRIQPCIEYPVRAIKTNTLGTGVVLQCAREAGVKRVIYSSTSACYGLKNSPPMVETMPLDCLNPYAFTKIAGEDLCKMYSMMFGLETIIFRYFNVYGERSPIRGQYAPVIGVFMRQRDAGELITVVGDGEQRRDFVHVKDVARANLLAAEFTPPEYMVTDNIVYNSWKWGEIFNIGSGENYSINEIATMVGGEKTHIPPREGEARHTLANTKKANTVLGWNPTLYVRDWINSKKV
jgi:UDP-glucose 4-epimerase